MIAPVALTLGDPAGIGGEIALRAWAELRGEFPFFLIGDPTHVAGLGARLGLPVRPIAAPGEAAAALTLAGLHEPLVGSGSGRRSRRSGQFTVVEDGIAGVEQPTIGRSDGHAAMTSGVARQRDEKDVRAEAIKFGGGKAEPVLGKRGVSAPAPFLTSGSRAPPLGRTVATGGDETFANAGGISFQRGKMNCGAGEIDEARRVVEIQVGHDDVADVAGVVAENAKLSDSSFRRVKPNTIDGAEERAERAGGLGWIDGYSTRVD